MRVTVTIIGAHFLIFLLRGVVGWCYGAGLTSSAGVSYNLDDNRARAYCAYSRCEWGCLDSFILLYPFSPLSPSLWETARYRLKYRFKEPPNLKQPTNQFFVEIPEPEQNNKTNKMKIFEHVDIYCINENKLFSVLKHRFDLINF